MIYFFGSKEFLGLPFQLFFFLLLLPWFHVQGQQQALIKNRSHPLCFVSTLEGYSAQQVPATVFFFLPFGLPGVIGAGQTLVAGDDLVFFLGIIHYADAP